MSKIAIKYSDLLALADKHRIGKTDLVSFFEFFADAKEKAIKSNAVARFNYWDVEAARKKVSEKRYCKTKKELYGLLGIGQKTFYSWLDSIGYYPRKQRVSGKYSPFYDAKDLFDRFEAFYNETRQDQRQPAKPEKTAKT